MGEVISCDWEGENYFFYVVIDKKWSVIPLRVNFFVTDFESAFRSHFREIHKIDQEEGGEKKSECVFASSKK